jgi:hypothetical protein
MNATLERLLVLLTAACVLSSLAINLLGDHLPASVLPMQARAGASHGLQGAALILLAALMWAKGWRLLSVVFAALVLLGLLSNW